MLQKKMSWNGPVDLRTCQRSAGKRVLMIWGFGQRCSALCVCRNTGMYCAFVDCAGIHKGFAQEDEKYIPPHISVFYATTCVGENLTNRDVF